MPEFKLLNLLESIYSKAIDQMNSKEPLHESFQYTSALPNIIVHKIHSQMQKNKRLLENKNDKVEFVKICLGNYTTTKNLTVSTKQRIAEAVVTNTAAEDFGNYAFDMSNDDTREDVKAYAAKIMKMHKCDVYSALAYAMKDCEPNQCDLPANVKEHVDEHFSPEDIEQVKQMSLSVNEGFDMDYDREEDPDFDDTDRDFEDDTDIKDDDIKPSSSLSNQDKAKLIKYAKRYKQNEPSLKAEDALQQILDNTPKTKKMGLSVRDVFSSAEIRDVDQYR